MWVVKVGGSLASHANLRTWLRALAPFPVLVVPGGGPFADVVRHAQNRWGFGNRVAHDMAILAMQQYGRMLADLGGGLRTFSSTTPGTDQPSAASIWLPNPDDLSDIPPSWAMTSDSLAAWLAGKMGATDLLLIKAALHGQPEKWPYAKIADIRALAAKGLVDPVFPRYTHSIDARCWLCGPDQSRDVANMFTHPDDHLLSIAKTSGDNN